MKFLFDLFPVILFFAVFKIQGIFAATLAAMLATLAQIGWVKFRHGRVDRMLLASGLIILVFGGATLLFHDETFIKWKPSVLYWLFGAALLVSANFCNKNLIREMLKAQLELPEKVWHRLNLSWALFFAGLGFVNLYVAYHASTATWVNFKLFGTTGLMLVFIIGQGLYLARYTEKE